MVVSEDVLDARAPPPSRLAVESKGRPWMGTSVRSIESATRMHEVVLSPPIPVEEHVGVPSPMAKIIGVDSPAHDKLVKDGL